MSLRCWFVCKHVCISYQPVDSRDRPKSRRRFPNAPRAGFRDRENPNLGWDTQFPPKRGVDTLSVGIPNLETVVIVVVECCYFYIINNYC